MDSIYGAKSLSDCPDWEETFYSGQNSPNVYALKIMGEIESKYTCSGLCDSVITETETEETETETEVTETDTSAVTVTETTEEEEEVETVIEERAYSFFYFSDAD